MYLAVKVEVYLPLCLDVYTKYELLPCPPMSPHVLPCPPLSSYVRLTQSDPTGYPLVMSLFYRSAGKCVDQLRNGPFSTDRLENVWVSCVMVR